MILCLIFLHRQLKWSLPKAFRGAHTLKRKKYVGRIPWGSSTPPLSVSRHYLPQRVVCLQISCCQCSNMLSVHIVGRPMFLERCPYLFSSLCNRTIHVCAHYSRVRVTRPSCFEARGEIILDILEILEANTAADHVWQHTGCSLLIC